MDYIGSMYKDSDGNVYIKEEFSGNDVQTRITAFQDCLHQIYAELDLEVKTTYLTVEDLVADIEASSGALWKGDEYAVALRPMDLKMLDPDKIYRSIKGELFTTPMADNVWRSLKTGEHVVIHPNFFLYGGFYRGKV